MRQRLIALPGGSETRSAIGSTTSGSASAAPHQRGPTPLHIVRRWDTDARVAAWEQAQDAAARDPDAAAYLLDCLSADVPAQGVAADATDDATDMDSDDVDDVDDVDDADADERSHRPGRSASRASGSSVKPFDPMRLLARAAKFYRWSHHDMMKTPWRTFLGYVREADIMTQEEQAQLDAETARGRRRYSSADGPHGADAFASVPRARR